MIFLFNFTIVPNGIDFVLNEQIAKDMPLYGMDYENDLKRLSEVTAGNLGLYKQFSSSNVILSCNIIGSEVDIQLSPGLGKYIDPYIKNEVIFENAKLIYEILAKVMDRACIANR